MKKILLFIKQWWSTILIGITVLVLSYYLERYSTNRQYNRYFNEGYNSALDTVNSIMKAQLKADTSHCTMIIIDTTKYILTHKCR